MYRASSCFFFVAARGPSLVVAVLILLRGPGGGGGGNGPRFRPHHGCGNRRTEKRSGTSFRVVVVGTSTGD